jgi:hypothetical protein
MIKRISYEETINYTLLNKSNPKWIDNAVAFTLTPLDDGWELITYYGKIN